MKLPLPCLFGRMLAPHRVATLTADTNLPQPRRRIPAARLSSTTFALVALLAGACLTPRHASAAPKADSEPVGVAEKNAAVSNPAASAISTAPNPLTTQRAAIAQRAAPPPAASGRDTRQTHRSAGACVDPADDWRWRRDRADYDRPQDNTWDQTSAMPLPQAPDLPAGLPEDLLDDTDSSSDYVTRQPLIISYRNEPTDTPDVGFTWADSQGFVRRTSDGENLIQFEINGAIVLNASASGSWVRAAFGSDESFATIQLPPIETLDGLRALGQALRRAMREQRTGDFRRRDLRRMADMLAQLPARLHRHQIHFADTPSERRQRPWADTLGALLEGDGRPRATIVLRAVLGRMLNPGRGDISLDDLDRVITERQGALVPGSTVQATQYDLLVRARECLATEAADPAAADIASSQVLIDSGSIEQLPPQMRTYLRECAQASPTTSAVASPPRSPVPPPPAGEAASDPQSDSAAVYPQIVATRMKGATRVSIVRVSPTETVTRIETPGQPPRFEPSP